MLMLKEFREASGLKIAQVAERTGVPYETYRKWEKGDSNRALVYLAAVLLMHWRFVG